MTEHDSIATIQQRHVWLDSQVFKSGTEREYLRDVGTLLTKIAALRGALAPLVKWWESRYYRVRGTEVPACVICLSTGGHATNCPIVVARALLADPPTGKGEG